MTTQDPQTVTTPEATAEPEAQAPAPEATGPAPLREAKERADKRADDYRDQLVDVQIKAIGLEPDKGLGVAIKESFKGEPTLAEVQAFASEKYQHQAPPPPGQPAQEFEAAQELGNQVMGQAQVIPPENDPARQVVDQVQQRYAAGDPEKTVEQGAILGGIAAKMQNVSHIPKE